jgi:hypothetical protein
MDTEEKIREMLKDSKIELISEAKFNEIMTLANKIKQSTDLSNEKKRGCYDALLVIADLTGDLTSKQMLISRTKNTR